MRMPSKKLLQHTVTIFNRVPNISDKPVNGGFPETWQGTVIRNVRFEIIEGVVRVQSHNTVSDSFMLFIFPAMTDTGGRKYIDPVKWLDLSPIDCADFWTMQKNIDYISIGENLFKPSYENKGERNDFLITAVDTLYNPSGSVHHFEVYGK